MIPEIATFLTLAYASYEDVQSFSVHDKVFVAGFLVSLGGGLALEGPGVAGAMFVQSLLAVFFGFLLQIFKSFGTADIWACALVVSVFPDVLIFVVLFPVLVSTLFWTKIYCFLARSRRAPAIPGIFLGFLIALSYHGI